MVSVIKSDKHVKERIVYKITKLGKIKLSLRHTNAEPLAAKTAEYRNY